MGSAKTVESGADLTLYFPGSVTRQVQALLLEFLLEGEMRFVRMLLNNSVKSLLLSSDPTNRCVGRNFLIEENVSDRRRAAVEAYMPASGDVQEVVMEYFMKSVQGEVQGHIPSTFDKEINHLALIPLKAIDPNWKFVRLERISYLLRILRLSFDELKIAHARGDEERISALVRQFRNFTGERPFFSVFKADIENILQENDWLNQYIESVGLFHYYLSDPMEPGIFALMEYSAGEFIQQARAKGIEKCFAYPTVLESGNNPAFCPSPRLSGGYAVDLRDSGNIGSGVREILHVRIDYSWEHVKMLGMWSGADTPDVEMAGVRHLDFLRRTTGRMDFGVIGE